MKRKLYLIFLCLFSVCNVLFAYDFYIKTNYVNIYYNITNSEIGNRTVEITGSEEPYIKTVTIPTTVSYGGKKYSVTGIGDGAFSQSKDLEEVIIPNSIKYIGSYAFQYTGLKSLVIPESVETVGDYVFSGSSQLETIVFPNSISDIGENPFGSRTALKHSVYNDKIFAYCVTQDSVFFVPEGIKYCCQSFFSVSCPNLKKIIFPESLDSISVNLLGTANVESIVFKTPTPPKYNIQSTLNPVNKSVIIYVSDKSPEILKAYQADEKLSLCTIIATNLDDMNIQTPADVDKNGEVNSADIVCIYNHIQIGERSGITSSSADVDGNEEVNSADVVAVYNYVQNGNL